jgi:putative transposase
MVAATVRTIFAQPDPDSTRAHLRTVADTLEPRFGKVAELLLAAEADVTAYADFPRAHHRKIASTNPLSDASTKNSNAAPTSSASSPTTPRSSASSAPCCSRSTTAGKPATAATYPKGPWH